MNQQEIDRVIQLTEDIIRVLVDDQDSVSIESSVIGKSIILSIEVAPKDIGKVIGKKGHTIGLIRGILDLIASKHMGKIIVTIDDGPF